MELYYQLKRKFEDKGLMYEFQLLVLSPFPFMEGKLTGTIEEQQKFYIKAVNDIYAKEWDYWNTWIDYQNHKF